MSDEAEDIKEIRKLLRLHDRQFKEIKDRFNEAMIQINNFMEVTNRIQKLHEQAIGILSARQKKMSEGK